MGDIHISKTSHGAFQALFTQISSNADVLALCGDFTDYGLPEEARILARELTTAVKIPVIAVLGNHDYESGQQDEIRRILTDAGVAVLDGEATEVHGVGFAGAKGFGGGFGRGALGPWGEQAIKQFVQEAVDEALKLESALARLRTHRRVALLHYSPSACDGRGRAAGDLSVSRLEPSRGADQPVSRQRRVPRSRPSWRAGRTHCDRRARVQRGDAAAARTNPDRPPYLVVELPLDDRYGRPRRL